VPSSGEAGKEKEARQKATNEQIWLYSLKKLLRSG
jgi:hypothetical protein